MEERVQDCVAEYFEESQHQSGKVQDDLARIKRVLKQIMSVQRPKKGTESFHEEATMTKRTMMSKEDTFQIISQASLNFRLKLICCKWMKLQHRNHGRI
jgi:hypothetical protein